MDDSQGFVKVLGYRMFYRSFGTAAKGTVLCLHGGPGASHEYLLPLADLAQFGYRVVLFDQLGCGHSERPRGTSLYTVEHNVEEVERVRKALKLGRVHLFGSSYGGALVLATALKYQRNLRSLIVASGLASTPLTVREMWRLIDRMPPGLRRTIHAHNKSGDFQNPGYLKAVEAFYRRHLCRLPIWPHEVVQTLENMGLVYQVMNGPNEFTITGVIRDWDVTDQLPRIQVPTLVTVGKYDEVTPRVAREIHHGIRGSKLVQFNASSHLAFWEQRPLYVEVVRDFLEGVR
jgi:proline iminopeptidase